MIVTGASAIIAGGVVTGDQVCRYSRPLCVNDCQSELEGKRMESREQRRGDQPMCSIYPRPPESVRRIYRQNSILVGVTQRLLD